MKQLALKAIALLFIVLASCSKGEKESNGTPIDPVDQNFQSDYKYNLNVVYFVPKDVVPNPAYEERISKIMIAGQSYFQQWMEYWGLGPKTFGLLKNKDNTRIKIHLVKGDKNSTAYTDDAAIVEHVNAYFLANPGVASSDHYLVLTAVNKKLDQGEVLPHEVPFYGTGKWCYALDYPGMSQDNLGKSGLVGEKATIYIGGLLHEMGHGINLPHNGPTASQYASSRFGMTLMGAGNYTYGKSPTFISFFDAATLSNCQVFSKETKAFYGSATTKVDQIAATVEGSEIVVQGSYTTNVAPTHVTIRNILESDPEGYQSITFTQKAKDDNSFNVRMPISEFRTKANMNYTLQIFLHHKNGSSSYVFYPYKFVNNIPVIDIATRPLLDRKNWTIESVSSFQVGYQPTRVLDGNEKTYWHTSWSNPGSHPHHITVNVGENAVNANGVSYLTRPDNTGAAAKIKEFKVEVSMDNQHWEVAYSGRGALNGRQYFPFATSKTFRYFRFVTVNDFKGENHASIAELDLY